MNILYIMRYWPVYGGGETVTATLANEFIKRGHQVHISYTYEHNISSMPYELDERIQTYQTHTIEAFQPNDITKLHNYIIDHHIDIMINQWGNTSLCAKAKEGTDCKLITCWHVNVLMNFPMTTNSFKRFIYTIIGRRFKKWWNNYKQLCNHKQNYVLSDKYVFLSPVFANLYKHLSGNKDRNRKISAIPNPLTYDFKYSMSHYSFKQKEVLFVGRICEYPKRLSYVIQIWSEIEKDNSLNDWQLTIVGDGPDLDLTKNLANSLGIKRISYTGFTNPRPFYEKSSIFIMTSATEGFGMTLVEAQQYGVVPIVMNSYLSLHDIIKDGKNGIIIPNDDIPLFVMKMKNLMRDADCRKRLAVCGLETCKKFSASTICDNWELLFKELKG